MIVMLFFPNSYPQWDISITLSSSDQHDLNGFYEGLGVLFYTQSVRVSAAWMMHMSRKWNKLPLLDKTIISMQVDEYIKQF